MSTSLFRRFLRSKDNLWVYEGDKLLFTSTKGGLLPLIEYIDSAVCSHNGITIFDKIMGNAAALLSVKACCRKVYSPLASELALKTLGDYGVKYHFAKIVPYIQNRKGERMCPMEELSINKGPEEFYEAVKRYFSIESSLR